MTTMPPDTDGWAEYRVFVLSEMKRYSSLLEDVTKCLVEIKTDIATLKVRSSVWGAVGGAVIAAAIVLWQLLVK